MFNITFFSHTRHFNNRIQIKFRVTFLLFTGDSKVKYRQDDAYLLRFLRVRKYDIKKAHQNVKLFFELRKKHPEFFNIPHDLKSLQQLNWYTILPYTDEEGRIIFLLNFSKYASYFYNCTILC